MGSYCALNFDDMYVVGEKSSVPDSLISLFQETDRQIAIPQPDEEERTHCYVAPREVILQRMDILGLTSALAREAFEHWHRSEIEMYAEWVEEGNDWAKDKFEALKTLDFEAWKARVPFVLKNRYGPAEVEGRDVAEREMIDLNESWLFFDVRDERLIIRAMLEACSSVKDVTLDISDLIGGGWLPKDISLCEAARAPGAIARPMLEPITILGEGRSDIRILRRSLQVLYPELVDYFGFFDHEELRVDGGTTYLVKFLQAFAGAKISNKIVAVFDNDTAGLEAFARASALPLPSNIVLLKLPDIELARAYPTIGPQGEHLTDVNGRAASIEMYLGRQNLLKEEGKLTPVRWGGYVEKMKAYQGEVEGKADIVKRFERGLAEQISPKEIRQKHPELAEIWRSIFSVINH